MTALQATDRLLRSFRARKPLRVGSLLVTIFGDAIAPRGGVVTLGSLIRLAALFGLPDRLVRTSVARLAHDGWLVARREGRRSEYRLTTDGEQRFADATRRIYGVSSPVWDGQWTLLLLPPLPSSQRERLRTELRWLGFGQWSGGLLAHPSTSVAQARQWLQRLGITHEVIVLQSSSGELAIDRRLAATGWDLGDLGRRYRRFLGAFAPVRAALAHGPERSSPPLTPEAAFVTRTLLIHEYRKIHLLDPLLPAPLLPTDWVGTSAYELCGALYNRVFEAAEACLIAAAATLTAPLPPFDARSHTRFLSPDTTPRRPAVVVPGVTAESAGARRCETAQKFT